MATEDDCKSTSEEVTDTSKRVRVLFLHGFESGTNGLKAKILKRKFTTYAPNLEIGMSWKKTDLYSALFVKRNHMIRLILLYSTAYPIGMAFLLAPAYLLNGGLSWDWPKQIRMLMLCLLLCALAIFFIFKPFIAGNAVRASMEGCLEIAREAIADFKPDIIVGSSWGGAVLSRLMHNGDWKGPSLLLCPAVSKVARLSECAVPLAGLRTPNKRVKNWKRWLLLFDFWTLFCFKRHRAFNEQRALRWLDLRWEEDRGCDKRALIVHGTADQTIPIEDSEELSALNPRLKLYRIEGDNHYLTRLVKAGQLPVLVQATLFSFHTIDEVTGD